MGAQAEEVLSVPPEAYGVWTRKKKARTLRTRPSLLAKNLLNGSG